MRRQHFELFAPICPVCRSSNGEANRLELARVDREHEEHIIEGLLHCSRPECQREYPIIDGIPLIIADIRRYLSENASQVCQRDDFSETIESVIGDCCGPGSQYDMIRQHLSSYTWDHYADLDPSESESEHAPGAIVRLLRQGLALTGEEGVKKGPMLDVGCSVGRTTFELAERFHQPVLGVDLNFPMLRLAGSILRGGRVRYPRRRVGIVYDRREFSVPFQASHLVDFWACDATALPLLENQCETAISLNLLDCVHSPLEFLASLQSVLKPGGSAVISSPYDWSSSATAIEGWFGGHSQRGPDAGASDVVLRSLLTSGHSHALEHLNLIAETDAHWHVRMHSRSVVSYKSHLIAVRKSDKKFS